MGKNKAQYPYSPELKKPYHYGDTDYENPLMQQIMKLVFLQMRAKAKRYMRTEEAGVRKTMLQIPIGSGAVIPCFVIEPADCAEALPAIMYYHGGAFFAPTQRVMLEDAVFYARALNCRVFMPEYRLTPKYPFPVPFNDACAAFFYVTEHARALRVDARRVVIYGDSAGGCLAAALTHLMRERKDPPAAGQVLIYPVTDHSMNHASMDAYQDAVWSRSANRHMWNMYLARGGEPLKYASPLNADDFSGLPPAYVEPQEIDALRDEAVAYAQKLKAAGVPTEVNIIPASYHGFDEDRESPLVKRVLEHRKRVIQRMFENGGVQASRPGVEP